MVSISHYNYCFSCSSHYKFHKVCKLYPFKQSTGNVWTGVDGKLNFQFPKETRGSFFEQSRYAVNSAIKGVDLGTPPHADLSPRNTWTINNNLISPMSRRKTGTAEYCEQYISEQILRLVQQYSIQAWRVIRRASGNNEQYCMDIGDSVQLQKRCVCC